MASHLTELPSEESYSVIEEACQIVKNVEVNGLLLQLFADQLGKIDEHFQEIQVIRQRLESKAIVALAKREYVLVKQLVDQRQVWEDEERKLFSLLLTLSSLAEKNAGSSIFEKNQLLLQCITIIEQYFKDPPTLEN